MDPLTTRLPQPDRRTCGAAVLVVARMINDPAYADRVATPAGFRRETLAMHRRTTSSIDVAGHLQLPWPLALGTPPWAVANQMDRTAGPASGGSGVPGTAYRPHLVLPGRREDALAGIRAAAEDGHVVPLFIGSRWLPRHVVLVLDSELHAYEPSSGARTQIRSERFLAGELGVAGWDHPWFSVLPVRRSPA